MISEQEKAEIERRAREALARAEKATPGPWKLKPTKHLFGDDSPVFEIVSKTNFARTHTRTDGGWYVIAELMGEEDANLFAHSRQDVPTLAADVLRLLREVTK